MRINLNQIVLALSDALDAVEGELAGASRGHSKRVARMAAAMGEACGMEASDLNDLQCAAALHDNALTEYLATEFDRAKLDAADPYELSLHCSIGAENIRKLPLSEKAAAAVRFHHENADGSGAFGRTAADTPREGKILHIADAADVRFDIRGKGSGERRALENYCLETRGSVYDEYTIDLFLSVATPSFLDDMDRTDELLKDGGKVVEDGARALAGIADVFKSIIDYKSDSTSRHSRGIAEKASRMASYYGFDRETADKFYFSAALHDIGKLYVRTAVLEKPGSLDAEEFAHVQNHAAATFSVLSAIDGMEDVTRWAAYHHEKLDGSGYPFGLTAASLDANCRLMAVLDIYQALTERRPYKDGMPHKAAMKLIYRDVEVGKLDANAAADVDTVFGKRK